jgi:hypothetical protein
VGHLTIPISSEDQEDNQAKVGNEEQPGQETRPGKQQVQDEQGSKDQTRLPGVESVGYCISTMASSFASACQDGSAYRT